MYTGTHARLRPVQPAFIMAATGEAVTYRELEARSNRLAHLFREHGLRRLDHPSTWVSHVAWIGLVTSAVLAVIARFWEQPRLWFLDLVPLLPIAAVLARSLHLRLPKGTILATVLFMALFGTAGQLLFAPFR